VDGIADFEPANSLAMWHEELKKCVIALDGIMRLMHTCLLLLVVSRWLTGAVLTLMSAVTTLCCLEAAHAWKAAWATLQVLPFHAPPQAWQMQQPLQWQQCWQTACGRYHQCLVASFMLQ
jgi:hypothetical protein